MAIPYVVQCKNTACRRVFSTGRYVTAIFPRPTEIDPDGTGVSLTCPQCGRTERYLVHEFRGWLLGADRLAAGGGQRRR